MRREIIRAGVPVTTPWNDDFQRIIRNFVGDADASLTGAFSPALDVEETEEGFTLGPATSTRRRTPMSSAASSVDSARSTAPCVCPTGWTRKASRLASRTGC